MAYLTLTGNYGYNQTYIKTATEAGSTIDASAASWTLNNDQDGIGPTSRYPVVLDSAGLGTRLIGGTINGEVSLTADWRELYYTPSGSHNDSKAIGVRYSPGVIITDWRINQVWDGIRPDRQSDNFIIEDVWISNARDDAIENDHVLNGTIRDSLLEDNFSQVSLGNGDQLAGGSNVVTFDHVLMKSKEYLLDGQLHHASPIKYYTAAEGVSPKLRFIDTVMAITEVDHTGYARLQATWQNTIEARGNVFLNLSDTPLPSNYPKPGAGWTILEGQIARDYWAAARAAWMDNQDGTPVGDTFILPALPGTSTSGSISTPTAPTTAAPAPLAPTFSGTNYAGTSRSETIVGNDLDNRIEGKDGGDQVWGGAGNDIFVFSRGGDMDGDGKVDLYMDFTHGADRFDFSAIDANVKVKGYQDFTFIGSSLFTAPGQVRAVYDSTTDSTRVYLNTDTDTSAEHRLDVAGQHSFTAADFIL